MRCPTTVRSSIRPRLYRSCWFLPIPMPIVSFFTESMSDNVTDRGNTLDPYVQPDWNRANRQAFYWEDIDMTYQDSPNYFWMASYQAIAAANHALEAIAELEAKGVDCSAQKGEALLCRAYNHFMLVNVFAQHYNPAFAAIDMGVAYVTEPEKESVRALRACVGERNIRQKSARTWKKACL